MAQVSGGDITEVTYSNPVVPTGRIFAISGEDSDFDLGGFRNDDGGAVDGAGRFIIQKNRKPWMFNCTFSNDMGGANEFEAMNALQASNAETTFTISLVNGVSYRGSGAVVGELKLNGNKSTFELNIMGGGFLIQM